MDRRQFLVAARLGAASFTLRPRDAVYGRQMMVSWRHLELLPADVPMTGRFIVEPVRYGRFSTPPTAAP